jgi:hypothetical protein
MGAYSVIGPQCGEKLVRFMGHLAKFTGTSAPYLVTYTVHLCIHTYIYSLCNTAAGCYSNRNKGMASTGCISELYKYQVNGSTKVGTYSHIPKTYITAQATAVNPIKLGVGVTRLE